MASIQVRAMPLAWWPDHGFHRKVGGRSMVWLPEVVVRAQRTDVPRGFLSAVLGVATFLASGCVRDLDSATMQTRVVRLVGPTCDAVKAGTAQTVWVEWYCTGVP